MESRCKGFLESFSPVVSGCLEGTHASMLKIMSSRTPNGTFPQLMCTFGLFGAVVNLGLSEILGLWPIPSFKYGP